MEKFFVNQVNNNAAVIGGVRLLAEFTRESIVVKVVGGEVRASGRDLSIARFSENEIEIRGVIDNIETVTSRVRTVKNQDEPSQGGERAKDQQARGGK